MRKTTILSLMLSVSTIFCANLIGKSNRNIEKVSADTSIELPAEQLGVSLVESTSTETTQTFGFSFSTNKSVYSSARYVTCKVIVTDPGFYDDGVDRSKDKDYPEFDAAIYQITGSADSSSPVDVVIPESVIYSNIFKLNIKSIYSNCIDEKKSYITKIIIPESVETIPADAFSGVRDETEFYYVSDTEKAGWETGWNQGHDLTSKNSYEYVDKQAKEARDASYSISNTSNNGYQFVLGYYDKDKENYWQPLVLNYDLMLDGEIIERKTAEFKLTSSSSLLDRVGSEIGAEDIVRLSVCFDKEEKYSINLETLVISNIYRYSGDIHNAIDFASGACSASVVNATTNKTLSDFISISATRFVALGNYVYLSTLIDTVDGIYEKINPTVWNENKADIESGLCKVRFKFTSIFESSFVFTYYSNGELKTSVVDVESPYSFFSLEKPKENKVGFLLKKSDICDDFSFENVKSIEFSNFYITLDIFSNDTNNVVSAQASVYTQFGRTYFYNNPEMTAEESFTVIPVVNLNKAFFVICLIAVLSYLAVGTFLFFYYKKAFKNDEFRRLKPKQFIKKGLIYFLGYAFIVLSLTFITFRWGFLNNTIVVFNPLDVYVIVFTIAAAISLGLFIKLLVVSIKAAKKNKENKKLKLEDTVVEDGTK